MHTHAMCNTVLVIDEESFFMEPYITILTRSGYNILFCNRAAQAYTAVVEHRNEIFAVVLDIMMPPDDRYSEDTTSDGRTVGLAFLSDLRQFLPEVPVIILTNVETHESLSSKGIVEGPILRLVQKIACGPIDLEMLLRGLTSSQAL